MGGFVAAVLFLLAAMVLLAAAQRKEFLLTPVMLVVVAYVMGYPLENLFYDLLQTQGIPTKRRWRLQCRGHLLGFAHLRLDICWP
ncbi:MAG: hypothetical protein IPO57_09110 [Rhodocyclales bacterium]|nr:hypothetical protein [Rhodocyclales bacterium]